MPQLKVEDGLSIIVPTYREAKNIPYLVKRVASLKLPITRFEVLLVDDNSDDNTQEVVDTLRVEYPWLKLIIRRENRSWHKSILQGIQAAAYSILIFMDADLSHPPEIIPEMLALLNQGHADMVIGSRHIKGGSIDRSWPIYRKIISRLATLAIQPLLPAKVQDPLSGYIAIKKASYSLNGELWNPIGTKLALEIMVKSQINSIVEIPICFEQRKHGESKLMNIKMAINYGRQIQQLWAYKLLSPRALAK